METGFAVVEFAVNGHPAPWPGDADSVAHLLKAADETKQFDFRAWHDERRLEVYQHVAWDLPGKGGKHLAWIVTSTDNTPYFWREEYNPVAYSQFFLDLGKRLYAKLQPSFGWIDFDYGLTTTHADIESLELPALYWANFFGPCYVAKFGREHILRAPAWRIEALPDGGLLYVLAPCPALADEHVSADAVRAHFGVPNVR
ncbi:MAG: hypothetical protein HYY04_19000 [Chloroflexi bacterium]|nr:hypothetical protein [Chloroflexota bacterium]